MTTEELIKKAEELFEKEDYDGVIKLLPDDLLEREKSAPLYAWRARAHDPAKESDIRLFYANKAIDTDSNCFLGYFARARAWEEKREYDYAINDCNTVIELNRDYYYAYYNRGVNWGNKGRDDKAIEDYNEAIRQKSDYARPYNNRGLIWYRKGNLDKALEDFNEAIRLKKNIPEAFVNRGIILTTIGNYNEAIQDYDTAIKLNGKLLIAYRNKGLTLEKKGDYEAAYKVYEEALSIDTSDSQTKLLLDKLAAKLNKPTQQEESNGPYANNADNPFYKITNSLKDIKSAKEHGDLLQHYMKEIDPIIAAIRKQATHTESIWQSIGNEYDATKSKYVAHYTNLKIADLIIMKNEKEVKDAARLRYSNAVFMNDPEEGKVLIDCLDHLEKDGNGKKDDETDASIKKAFYSVLKEEKTNFYIGSFLPAIKDHEDELLMWRTYGKDENANEAAGCCLVIDTNLFDEGDGQHIAMHDESISTTKEQHPLYKVLYYNKRDKKFNDENNGRALTDEVIKLKNALRGLLDKKKNDDTEESKIHNKAIEKVLYHSLSELRYFFKSADYAYENELRVIQFATHSDTVTIDKDSNAIPRKVYINSSKEVKPHLKKIVLGPMVRHPERWMYLGKHMEDTGHKIDMVYSNCHFQ